mmetsp:Transcript_10286/g.20496  ORF Transcript_10286/g.20496 Transcript_10286/m.20496 type:complete len:234 (-) Transcript_10286:922-1623(-)
MLMTSSILRTIFTTWVARRSCCCFPMRVSKTPWVFMSLVPVWLQSTPRKGFLDSSCLLLTLASSSMGERPQFSARARGMSSRASEKARMAYWSVPMTVSAWAETAREQAISADPPPYTTLLSLMRLRTTHMASCRLRLASSTIILFPPLTTHVTALELAQSSILIIFSLVVPKVISVTLPAFPSFSGESSEKRGMILAPVAMAMSSSSTPFTQRMAGRLFCKRRWLASSSKPH